MEKYSEYKDAILSELSDTYSKLQFDCVITDFNVRITTFFVLGLSKDIAECDNWQKISEDIALKYQSKIEMPFDKWNIYIIYIGKDEISKDFKNKIETDKFSSRKIVEDNFAENFTGVKAKELLVKHITNIDLDELVIDKSNKENNIPQTVVEYVPYNSQLWKAIPKEDIKGNKNIQEKLLFQIEKMYHEN